MFVHEKAVLILQELLKFKMSVMVSDIVWFDTAICNVDGYILYSALCYNFITLFI